MEALMFRFGSLVTAAIFVAGPALAAEPSTTALPVISGAVALSGSVKANTQSGAIPDLLLAESTTKSKKTVTETVSSYSNTLRLAFGTDLVVSSGKIVDSATYKVPGKSELTSTGSSSLASAYAELKAPTGGQLVTISAKSLSSTASFSKLTGKAAVATATTKISDLVVDLTGLGLGTYKYTGTPKPNTKLYSATDGSVIVYLNKQTENVTTPDDFHPEAATLKSVDVDAVSVVVTDLTASGFTVSGTITLGTSFASAQ